MVKMTAHKLSFAHEYLLFVHFIWFESKQRVNLQATKNKLI